MNIVVDGHEIEIGRKPIREYKKGCMICKVAPWGASGCPITLEIAINPDGTITHRGWTWSGTTNSYLHLMDINKDVDVTKEMADTVGGLFSGRIKVDGIKISVGATVQDICPIDIKKEEKKIGKTIFLNGRY